MNDQSKSVDDRALAIRRQFGDDLRKQVTLKRALVAGGAVVVLAVILPLT